MKTINVTELAMQMRKRKEAGEKPYVLFLGAGVSISSGVSGMSEVVDKYLVDSGTVSEDKLGQLDRETRFETFFSAMESMNEIDRYSWLLDAFKNRKPSVGYHALTHLIEDGYFDIILTTNWDNILETCLERSNKISHQDYRFYILEIHKAGVIINEVENFVDPRVKILKLHGDLSRQVILVTPRETAQFSRKIDEFLKRLFKSRDLMVVGYSLSDLDVLSCIRKNKRTIVFVNINPPLNPILLQTIYKYRVNEKIVGQDADFDLFMRKLCNELYAYDCEKLDEISLDMLSVISMDIKKVLQNTERLIKFLDDRKNI